MTYHQWDVIADAYVPLLFLISIIALTVQSRTLGLRRAIVDASAILSSIAIVYAVMALDNVIGLWPRLGLDYSTHTAIALAFVIYLSFNGKAIAAFALISMLMYAALMIYQEYHSVLDIMSTSVVVAPLFFLIMKLVLRDG